MRCVVVMVHVRTYCGYLEILIIKNNVYGPGMVFATAAGVNKAHPFR